MSRSRIWMELEAFVLIIVPVFSGKPRKELHQVCTIISLHSIQCSVEEKSPFLISEVEGNASRKAPYLGLTFIVENIRHD